MAADVAIVVPTFNRSASLTRLLDSLAGGGIGDVAAEVVVVDDGSTDDTEARVAAAAVPVTYLRQANAGPAVARNLGWRSSSAPLVVFLDDDVVVRPDAVARLVAAAPGAAGVGATIEPLGTPGVVAGFMHVEGLSDHKVVDGQVRYLVTAGALFHRDALEQVGGFDEAFPVAAGEDADLSMRLVDAGAVLGLEPSAVVLHDYRSTLPKLARTYYRHGSVQPLLMARHEGRGGQLKGSARERADPRAWAATYRRYRAGGAGPSRACAYLVLRAAMMVPWVTGAVMARRRGTGTDTVEEQPA